MNFYMEKSTDNVCIGPYGARFMTVDEIGYITIILYPNDRVSPIVTNIADKLQNSLFFNSSFHYSLQKYNNITATVLKLSMQTSKILFFDIQHQSSQYKYFIYIGTIIIEPLSTLRQSNLLLYCVQSFYISYIPIFLVVQISQIKRISKF